MRKHVLYFVIGLFGISTSVFSQYCSSSASNTSDEEIYSFTLNGSANALACGTAAPGAGSIAYRYSNFTTFTLTTVTQGQTVNFTVAENECDGATFYSFGTAIWMDYNQDGDFTDAGEQVFVEAATAVGPRNVTGSFTIPCTATAGTTRLRVIVAENISGAALTPCLAYTYGETEDYLIKINAATASAPGVATAPSPANSATAVNGCATTLSWTAPTFTTACDAASSYDIYFGTSSTPSLVTNTTTTSYNPGYLSPSTTYYWKVVPKNSNGSASATTWSFTTGTGAGVPGVASTPSPANGATLISKCGPSLSWTAPAAGCNGATSYDIYFGTAASPPFVSNTTSTSWSPGLLSGLTTYYWKVVAKNAAGDAVGSSTWSFVTSVTACANSTAPGGVFTGLQTWMRADIGVTGTTPITGWTNQNTGGTAVLVNGSPNLNNTSTSYNYNPYVDFTAPAGTYSSNAVDPTRQFLKLSGYNDISGLDYKSMFWTFQLNDLSRVYSHIATVDNVTTSAPANGTMHGDANAGGTTAAVLWESYDAADFGTSSPTGTWQRNGTNIASNADHSSSKNILSANCTTGGSTTLNRFLGGQRDGNSAMGNTFQGQVRDWKGPVAELIAYTSSLTTIERQKVHSYQAIKYGVTLTSDYLNTSGTIIYLTASPYNNNIIGIGRDDAEALTQKQSHNNDDTVRIYKGTLAAMNASNGSTFAVDKSYVVIGANNGLMKNSAAANAEIPSPALTTCTLVSRLEREWKVMNTNFAETFNMDLKLNANAIPTSVTVADLRFLVDDDGNFANGGTTCYYNGDGTGLVISYSNPVITITGISNTHIPNNGTKYITIGSVNRFTPLPIALIDFKGECKNDNTVLLKWSTASETNNHHFTIERSKDGVNFEMLGDVASQGNSNQTQTYTYVDNAISNSIYYYRLTQIDHDGTSKQFNMISVDNCETVGNSEVSILNLYPNPIGDQYLQLDYASGVSEKVSIEFKNLLGQELLVREIELSAGRHTASIAIDDLRSGVYFVQITSMHHQSKVLKLVKE